MVRVRHYTRINSMRRILAEGVVRAHDQNKVFVEKADARRLSPGDAVEKYGLRRGKANAYVEFDVEPQLLGSQYNTELKIDEWFMVGDVSLAQRDVEAFFNF